MTIQEKVDKLMSDGFYEVYRVINWSLGIHCIPLGLHIFGLNDEEVIKYAVEYYSPVASRRQAAKRLLEFFDDVCDCIYKSGVTGATDDCYPKIQMLYEKLEPRVLSKVEASGKVSLASWDKKKLLDLVTKYRKVPEAFEG